MAISSIVGIVVTVVVVAAVIGFVVSWSVTRRAQSRRQQSADVRAKAVALDRRLRADEAAEGSDQPRAGTA